MTNSHDLLRSSELRDFLHQNNFLPQSFRSSKFQTLANILTHLLNNEWLGYFIGFGTSGLSLLRATITKFFQSVESSDCLEIYGSHLPVCRSNGCHMIFTHALILWYGVFIQWPRSILVQSNGYHSSE
jgi:hypothetical protein